MIFKLLGCLLYQLFIIASVAVVSYMTVYLINNGNTLIAVAGFLLTFAVFLIGIILTYLNIMYIVKTITEDGTNNSN